MKCPLWKIESNKILDSYISSKGDTIWGHNIHIIIIEESNNWPRPFFWLNWHMNAVLQSTKFSIVLCKNRITNVTINRIIDWWLTPGLGSLVEKRTWPVIALDPSIINYYYYYNTGCKPCIWGVSLGLSGIILHSTLRTMWPCPTLLYCFLHREKIVLSGNSIYVDTGCVEYKYCGLDNNMNHLCFHAPHRLNLDL